MTPVAKNCLERHRMVSRIRQPRYRTQRRLWRDSASGAAAASFTPRGRRAASVPGPWRSAIARRANCICLLEIFWMH
eukprot:8547602-Pyramimonas_sp.AAC.1